MEPTLTIQQLIIQGVIIAVAVYAINFLICFTESIFSSNEIRFDTLDEYKEWIKDLETNLSEHKSKYKELLSGTKKTDEPED